jgi:NADPH-dependent 2,4-dienoyl-CoA reductase/sulfur reductase-like enzyme
MNTAARERLVVVGGSAAGARAAQTALALSPSRDVEVVTLDPEAPYYRPGLSKQLLQGAWTADQAAQPRPSGDALTWRGGVRAVALDIASQHVETDDGGRLPYDRLVIASGCRPRRLAQQAVSAPPQRRVFTIDRVQDVVELRRVLPPGGHVVVVGAGLVGSEAASSLALAGFRVTAIDPSLTPLARALGPIGDTVCAQWHRASSMRMRLGFGVEEVIETGDGVEVLLTGGELISGDVAICCLGVVPDTEWLIGSGVPLEADGGISCDRHLVVNGHANIAAAGDVATWDSSRTGRPTRVEHWLTAVEQGAVAARNVCAAPADRAAFEAIPMFWTEQHGHLVHFIGHHDPQSTWDLVEGQAGAEQLVAAARTRDRVTGFLLVDAARRMSHYRHELTSAGADVAAKT